MLSIRIYSLNKNIFYSEKFIFNADVFLVRLNINNYTESIMLNYNFILLEMEYSMYIGVNKLLKLKYYLSYYLWL
jgi:hypothetical protein